MYSNWEKLGEHRLVSKIGFYNNLVDGIKSVRIFFNELGCTYLIKCIKVARINELHCTVTNSYERGQKYV